MDCCQPNSNDFPDYYRDASKHLSLFFSSRHEARYLRIFCLILLLVELVTATLFWTEYKSDSNSNINPKTGTSGIVPYIIEVSENGSVRNIGELSPAISYEYEPNTASIRFFLSGFVKNIRSLPLDSLVIRDNYHQAYSYLTEGKGRNILTEYAKVWQPFARIQDVSVSVTIVGVIDRSDKSFQVTWLEQTCSASSGKKLNLKKYSGLFKILIQPPSTEEALKANPLGIYIDYFSISEELYEQLHD